MDKREKRIGFWAGVLTMMVLAAAMALVGALYTGSEITPKALLLTAVSAFLINFVTSLIIPASKLGESFAKTCGASVGTKKHYFLVMLVVTFIYVTVVSLGMTAISVGLNETFIPAWLHMYPVLFGAGYVVALLTMPLAMKLTSALLQPHQMAP
ncbi:MAG: hypothetical protein LBS53_06555 [Synergistaceae bacterium]|jgi:hypothetical protein|nr:hypothetical protein [Synergistaceae bacterium]